MLTLMMKGKIAKGDFHGTLKNKNKKKEKKGVLLAIRMYCEWQWPVTTDTHGKHVPRVTDAEAKYEYSN